MPRPLGLHQITAMSSGPVGLVALAAEVGCQEVCIFTHMPADIPSKPDGSPLFPTLTQKQKPEMLAAMAEHGVKVANIEFFRIVAATPIEDFRPALALGAELGARTAVTHIHDTDTPRAVETLGRLCDVAAEYGLALGLEFMGLTPGCSSITEAAWFVDQVARPNLAFAVDALHLIRTGGTAADIAALDPRYFSYAQICDARGLQRSKDYMAEAMNRELPGDGDFPLRAILDALPASTPLDVEVPLARLSASDESPRDHTREAVARSRSLVENAKPTR